MKKRILVSMAALAGTALLAGQVHVHAGDVNCVTAQCGDGNGPDVIVGNLLDVV